MPHNADGGDDGSGDGGEYDGLLDTLRNATALGVRLRDNPAGFVIATVVAWAVNTVFGVLAAIEQQLDSAGAVLTGNLRDAGVAVLSSFGAAGYPILVALSDLDQLLYSIAFETAPGAVIMLPVVWVSTIAVVAITIRLIVFVLPVG